MIGQLLKLGAQEEETIDSFFSQESSVLTSSKTFKNSLLESPNFPDSKWFFFNIYICSLTSTSRFKHIHRKDTDFCFGSKTEKRIS
jgi:hypothetical protein